MKQARLEIHCKYDDDGNREVEKQSDFIDQLIMDGFDVEVFVIVDGVREVSYSIVE